MKLLISPAKKMREDGDFLAPRQAPALLERAAVLAEWLRGLDYTALKKLLACNDGIAELNFRRFQEMDLRRPGTPALLSYDGIQYQYMAPHLFTRPQFEYAETHLRILSGFYGVLRPFDGVLPYRLEMGARCSTPFCKSLYDFWGDSLYRTLTAGGEDTLLNLASAEYAKAVRPWVTPPVRWIDHLQARPAQWCHPRHHLPGPPHRLHPGGRLRGGDRLHHSRPGPLSGAVRAEPRLLHHHGHHHLPGDPGGHHEPGG